MLKRANVYFSGSVQGVGFRYTARSLAQNHKIMGFVKNLSDGRVEIVAEGEENTLNNFLKSLREQMNYAHFKENICWQEPSGEFSKFEVRF